MYSMWNITSAVSWNQHLEQDYQDNEKLLTCSSVEANRSSWWEISLDLCIEFLLSFSLLSPFLSLFASLGQLSRDLWPITARLLTRIYLPFITSCPPGSAHAGTNQMIALLTQTEANKLYWWFLCRHQPTSRLSDTCVLSPILACHDMFLALN